MRDEGTIIKEELNYQKYMQNYSVPLNFFITLHVVAEDKEFMEEFVDMAIGEGKTDPLVLTYVETQQENTTIYEYSGTYKKEVDFWNSYAGEISGTLEEQDIINERDEEIEINNDNVSDFYEGAYSYNKQVVKSNSGKLYITKVDTWLKALNREVTYSPDPEPTEEGDNTYTVKDETYGPYVYEILANSEEITEENSEENLEPIISMYMQKLEDILVEQRVIQKSFSRKYTVADPQSQIIIQDFIDLIESYPKVDNNISTTPSNIFYLLQKHENTQRLEKIMRYVLYKLNDVDYGVTEADLEFLLEDDMLAVGGSSGGISGGGSVGEKIWFSLLSQGYSKESAAGVLGNLHVESGLKSNNMEDIYEDGREREISPGYTNETYTAAVDDGSYTNFINDAVGYGLAQWTWHTRKEGLLRFAQAQGKSVGDEDLQIEYLLGELGHSEYASGYANTIITSGSYTDAWKNAKTPEEAAEGFCWAYENPKAYSMSRETRAREYYDRYKDLEEGGVSQSGGDEPYVIGTFTSTITGKTFTVFDQMKIYTDQDGDGDEEVWDDRCNRCAQMSVCSGYLNRSPSEWVNSANRAPDNTMPAYKAMYDECGLTYAYQSFGGTTFDSQKIKEQIQNGGYVVIYLRGSLDGVSGVSKYQRDWAGSRHWVSILGYKVANGQEWIYVSDSGHGHTGWVYLDEFDNLAKNVIFVNEK